MAACQKDLQRNWKYTDIYILQPIDHNYIVNQSRKAKVGIKKKTRPKTTIASYPPMTLMFIHVTHLLKKKNIVTFRHFSSHALMMQPGWTNPPSNKRRMGFIKTRCSCVAAERLSVCVSICFCVGGASVWILSGCLPGVDNCASTSGIFTFHWFVARWCTSENINLSSRGLHAVI